mgnify:CR=1 FL=1
MGSGRSESMRFIHTADIHLGAAPDKGSPWSGKREQEIRESFYRLLDLANDEGIELLLIAGDLFHRPPLKRELKELNYRFESMFQTRVVMMPGNHDFLGPASNYNGFEWADNVTFFGKESMQRKHFPKWDLWVYGLGYCHREIKKPLYDHVRPGDEPGTHILLAHGGDEKHIPIDFKQLCAAGFDYAALGHIHKPQVIVPDRIAYSGSLEPTDRLDVGQRGYILGEIEDTLHPQVSTQFCPFSVREYKNIRIPSDVDMTLGKLEETLKRLIGSEGSQHIYNICLQGFRDPDIRFDEDVLMKLGNIASVKDETLPWFDFDQLYADNRDNLIGRFIGKVREMPMDDKRRQQILTVGIQALYSQEDR